MKRKWLAVCMTLSMIPGLIACGSTENEGTRNVQDISSEKEEKAVSNEADKQISDVARSMIEHLGYPHKVFAAGTDYDEIMKEYENSLERGKAEGFIPVLVPVDDTLDEFFGILKDDGYSYEDVLKKDIDAAEGERFLAERFEEYMSDMEEDFDMTLEDFIGVYDDDPEYIESYYSIRDYRDNKTLETIMFEVPTKNPWELVAYVPFGGWNECPEVEEMLAVCKYWYEKYGAVPVTISHDILEMSVPSPVSESDALEFAKEHYAFTPDRVDQGTSTNTLSEVAECLKVSKIWFFWWD